MADQPRRGRPTLAPSDFKRNKTFRVSDAVYADWLRRVSKLGTTISAVIVAGVERELNRLERHTK